MKNTKKTTGNDNNARCEFTEGIYYRHVANLVGIKNDKNWIYKGDSPFADGEILIGKKLNWYCKATKQAGDEIDFLRKENPLLTDQGAHVAWFAEFSTTKDWNGVKVLDDKSLRKELKTFRESVAFHHNLNASQEEIFLKNNFWINEAGEYNYMELSRTNKPLCRYHWGEKDDIGIFFITSGVSRIKEHPEASRIYFVDSPLELLILKQFINDPIYIKPDNLTFDYNDYLKMVNRKEVAFSVENGPISGTLDDFVFERVDGSDTDAVTSLLLSPRDY